MHDLAGLQLLCTRTSAHSNLGAFEAIQIIRDPGKMKFGVIVLKTISPLFFLPKKSRLSCLQMLIMIEKVTRAFQLILYIPGEWGEVNNTRICHVNFFSSFQNFDCNVFGDKNHVRESKIRLQKRLSF